MAAIFWGANRVMKRISGFGAAWLVSLAGVWQAGPALADDPAAVTFNKDVAPILFARCAGCHRPGEVAPFALLSYPDAAKRASLLAEVTSSREMPPWKAEPDAGHFAGERRLTAAEIGTIRRWADTGATEGDASDLAPPPQFTTGWQLGEPDLVVRMPEPYTLAATGADEYRCFVLPFQVPAGRYIRGVEFRPGNRKIVHHGVLTSMPHDQALARLAEGGGKSFLSGLAPPGRLLSGPLSIWTPGMEPHLLDGNLAATWPDGSDLVLQLHLHPSGKPEVEQSVVGIYLTDQKPTARLAMSVYSNNKIDIAPGQADFEVRTSRTLNAEATLFGVFPHMHLIGRSVRAEATLPDATKVPLITINDWDFDWQYYYQYVTPVRLPAGTKVDVRWTYDNSAGNPANPNHPPQRVAFGEQTADEMAFLVFDLIATGPAPAPRAMTPEALNRRASAAVKMLDKDNDGTLNEAELAAAPLGAMPPAEVKRRFAAADRNNDAKLDVAELVEVFKAMSR